MTLLEIKTALSEGKRVYQHHEGYQVIIDRLGQYLIKCQFNGDCIGLTWLDGQTMNGKEKDFFIG